MLWLRCPDRTLGLVWTAKLNSWDGRFFDESNVGDDHKSAF